MLQSGPHDGNAPSAGTTGITRRLAAGLYESLLLSGLVVLISAVFTIVPWPTGVQPRRTALQLMIFVAVGMYFICFWYKGQTLAMRTWNIRITDHLGQPLTWRRATVRYFACGLWFAPLLAAGLFPAPWRYVLAVQAFWIVFWAALARLHPDRQFWHDAWCGTRLEHFVSPRKRP